MNGNKMQSTERTVRNEMQLSEPQTGVIYSSPGYFYEYAHKILRVVKYFKKPTPKTNIHPWNGHQSNPQCIYDFTYVDNIFLRVE